MLLYEKNGKLNLNFDGTVKSTSDLTIEKVSPAINVKLDGTDVMSGLVPVTISLEGVPATGETITISESGVITASLIKSGDVGSEKGTLTLKVSSDDNVDLYYKFGSGSKTKVTTETISKEYSATGEDTLVITAESGSATFSREFAISVTLVEG